MAEVGSICQRIIMQLKVILINRALTRDVTSVTVNVKLFIYVLLEMYSVISRYTAYGYFLFML